MRHGAAPTLMLLLALNGTAPAYIERMYSLQEVLNESNHVVVGKIESVNPEKQLATATIERALKGQVQIARVQMLIGITAPEQARYVFQRLEVGAPFLLFIKRDGNNIVSLAHTGDTWLQFYASDEPDRRRVWWRMSHIEVSMGRTFNGTTADLVKLTEDVQAGRARAPAPNASVPRLDPSRAGPPLPPRAEDPRDGLEAVPGWYVDDSWARPARLTIEESLECGRTLLVQCDGQATKKLALAILLNLDLSTATHFVFDVTNGSDRELRIAVAFGAAPDWGMFEAPAVRVAPRASRATIRFPLSRPIFKSLASGWQHARPLPNGGRVDKILILIEGLPETASVVLDRIRATRGGFFRQLEFARAAGETRSISWTDFHGDGRLAAFVCSERGCLLVANDGKEFKDATERFGLAGGARTAAWADYTGDGRPDLLLGGASPTKSSAVALRLLTHLGASFRDDSGLLPSPSQNSAEAACWMDYNGDGLPDILAIRRVKGEACLFLYENTGKGPAWFRDVTEKVGLGPKGLGRSATGIAVADYDGDGYPDFFCDRGTFYFSRPPSEAESRPEGPAAGPAGATATSLEKLNVPFLAHNEGGRGFKLDTKGLPIADSRLPIEIRNPKSQIANPLCGAVFADFDNDGTLDLLLPGPGKPRLFRNNNDGTFSDVTDASGDLAKAAEPGVAAAWGDVDNDGFLDLFVCYAKGPGRLYLGDGKGGFRLDTQGFPIADFRLPVEIANQKSEIANLRGCASFADADDDGRLDLLVSLGNKTVLAFNEMAPAANCGSLTVRVAVRKGLIGAVVRVLDANGKPKGLRELATAGGSGQAPPVAHFGLPAGRYQLSVCLSDGRVAQKQVTIEAKAAGLRLDEGEFK